MGANKNKIVYKNIKKNYLLTNMISQDVDFIFKVLIIGDSSVGKSNILLRYTDNIFHETFLPTIGVDFKMKNVDSNFN